MSDIASIALSGMQASLSSFRAAASNIAHMNDKAPIAGSPGEPPAALYTPMTSVATTDPSGGVSASYAPTRPAYDVVGASQASSDADGEMAMPHVDLALAMVNISMAVQAFRANAAVARTADDMARAMLDIVS